MVALNGQSLTEHAKAMELLMTLPAMTELVMTVERQEARHELLIPLR
ncbi:hypothetical protein PCI56_11785 [Plesiomonas shigelloides subsp. oncorhynchi]|nr:hypothetical protein [Plesiomonas shigelloides]